MGTLEDVTVQGTDPVTGKACSPPRPFRSPQHPCPAGSVPIASRFFTVFAPGGTHAGWLTVAELRLVSEWLDIGAQYYNNPFDVPTN